MDAEETDDGEVSQHAVEVLGSVGSSDESGVLVALHGRELLGDLGLLDERVEHVEHTVAAPGVGSLAQDLGLLLIVALPCNSSPVGGEGVELIDELINHIPSPVVLLSRDPKSASQPHICTNISLRY